eukprot:1479320-Pyramimonas_sp.AAC.1
MRSRAPPASRTPRQRPIQKRLQQAKRRRYNPPWGRPLEVATLLLHPQYLARPGAKRVGLGRASADCAQADLLARHPRQPRRRKLKLDYDQCNTVALAFVALTCP